MIYVVSDGRVFADVFGISDADCTEYGQELQKMASEIQGPNNFLQFNSLEDFLGDDWETKDDVR